MCMSYASDIVATDSTILDTPPQNQKPGYVPPFLTLPTEVYNLTLTRVSWHDVTNLRLTHKHFALSILPSASLSDLHHRHQESTHGAELYHRHTTLGYTNQHWTGFSQGWGLSSRVSLSDTLPCYHCLRWLPSADATLKTSAFSRGMATGKRDLGMERSRSRVCVECGLRCGLYVPGNKVRHQVVCRGCGALGDQVRRMEHGSDQKDAKVGLLKGRELRYHHFCRGCVQGLDGRVPVTRVEYEHERRWRRYEDGLIAGKTFRARKGSRLRMERGIEDTSLHAPLGPSTEGVVSPSQIVSKRWCPTMGQFRMCDCWKISDGRMPDWFKWIDEKGQWIW